MFLLKHNNLDFNDLILIERYYLRSIKNQTFVTSDFNVLDCNRTDLYGHLLSLFYKLDILSTLNITPSQLLDFLIDLDSHYLLTPYHSFYHAADIVTVLYFIVTDFEASIYFTKMEIVVLFIAAICHDVGHPGLNNDFQIRTDSVIANTYNYISVLESYSIDISMNLLEKHHMSSIIHYKKMFKRLILATDMSNHFKLLENTLKPKTLDTVSLAEILLHAADISNTVRVWSISKQWSDRIVQEFFEQGDAELVAGLTVSPGMDRNLSTQANISLRFDDFIVKPFFDAIQAHILPKASVWIQTLEQNRLCWVHVREQTPPSISTRRQNLCVSAGSVVLPCLSISRTSSLSDLLVSNCSELRRGSVQSIL